MLLRVVLEALFVLALAGDGVYLARVGRPGRYPDRLIGWFMLSIGMAAIGGHAVLALFVGGVLAGKIAGWLYAVAMALQVAAIWFRAWVAGLATPRMRDGDTDGQVGSFVSPVQQSDQGRGNRWTRRARRGAR